MAILLWLLLWPMNISKLGAKLALCFMIFEAPSYSHLARGVFVEIFVDHKHPSDEAS
jgi:hypothetical protein